VNGVVAGTSNFEVAFSRR